MAMFSIASYQCLLCAKTGVRHRTGAVRRPFSTGNTALGGIDGGDCGGRSGLLPGANLVGCDSLSRYVAYYRYLYGLYRRSDHHYRHDPRSILNVDGVLYLGGVLYLAFFARPGGELLCLGTGGLYGADHCCDDPERTVAGASVCR